MQKHIKLDLEAFAFVELNHDTSFVKGGIDSVVPDGGAACDTPGGSKEGQFSWTSDTAVYNADGSANSWDYHGTVRALETANLGGFL